jgi:hypothetical protein
MTWQDALVNIGCVVFVWFVIWFLNSNDRRR